MKIQYIATPAEATLHIRTCILRAFLHDRVVRAAVRVAPDARLTHTGTFIIHSRISGEPAQILSATREARREKEDQH